MPEEIADVWHRVPPPGGAQVVAGRVGHGVAAQDTVDGPQQWILLAAAARGEIVQVESPDHAAAKSVVADVF